jgi:hypothetical protein
MFEFKVTTDMKISEVKELLCEKLKEEKQIEVDPNRMRLRETVALSVGREPFTVYLDHQLIKVIPSFPSPFCSCPS